MDKKTIVIGASPNSSRYAYTAVSRMAQKGIPVIPLGIKQGEIEGIQIQNDQPPIEDVHTISLYINPGLQSNYVDYLVSLRPKRVIFNPGTENAALMKKLREEGIETMAACTLVLLSTGAY